MLPAVNMATIDCRSDLQIDIASLLIQDNNLEMIGQSCQSNLQPQASNSSQTEVDIENILRNRSICLQVIGDMNRFGISVVDSFLGYQRGDLVYEEVINLHRAGLFTDGQLARNDSKNKNIRGDEVIWLVGNEGGCPHISSLITEIDKIVKGASRYANNGVLGKYKISDRTRVSITQICKSLICHFQMPDVTIICSFVVQRMKMGSFMLFDSLLL